MLRFLCSDISLSRNQAFQEENVVLFLFPVSPLCYCKLNELCCFVLCSTCFSAALSPYCSSLPCHLPLNSQCSHQTATSQLVAKMHSWRVQVAKQEHIGWPSVGTLLPPGTFGTYCDSLKAYEGAQTNVECIGSEAAVWPQASNSPSATDDFVQFLK